MSGGAALLQKFARSAIFYSTAGLAPCGLHAFIFPDNTVDSRRNLEYIIPAPRHQSTQVLVMKNPLIATLLFFLLALSQFACSGQQNSTANVNANVSGDSTAAAAVATPVATPDGNANSGVELPQPATADAQGYYALGIDLYKQNRDEQAAEAFRQATTLDPDFAMGFMKLALAYRALGKKEEATKAYEQAVKGFEKLLDDDPKNAEAQLNLGEAYSRLGDYQKSIEAYRRGVRLKEPDSTTYYDIGLTYNKLARYTEAVGAFKKSIELDPDDYRAQEALERAESDARRQRARIEEEKKKLERVVKATGNSNANNSNNANARTTNNKNQSPKNTGH
jgi:tetratricopeptide (TPR) repeat protein